MGLTRTLRVVITSLLLLSFFSLALLPTSFSVPIPPQLSYGPTWQQSCSGKLCTATLYPYIKYYDDAGQWKEISESFGTLNCQRGYEFCVDQNLYQVHAKSSLADSPLLLSWRSASITITPVSLSYQLDNQEQSIVTFSGIASIAGNTISYQLAPGVSLQYVYYADHLTQNLVFDSESRFPLPRGALLNPNTRVTLAIQVSGDFNSLLIPTPILYEQHGSRADAMSLLRSGSQLVLSFPLEVIYDTTARAFRYSFPLVIDPSFTLNDTNIRWNGYVDKHGSNNYTRISNPTELFVGRQTLAPGDTYRSSIEFNTTPIPDTARIDTAQLTLYVAQTGTNNPTVQVRHMEGTNASYPNTNNSNAIFFADMANGTVYGQADISTAPAQIVVSFALTSQSRLDMQASLPSDLFSLGLYNANESSQTVPIKFGARDYAAPSQRPILNITYELIASETQGRAAIEEGITASLPSSPIRTDQQVYLVNENGEQFLGRFDKAVQKDNQTWVFNYVTASESFTSMPSLFTVLNVWENSTLSTEEITFQVSTFINQTTVSP